MGSRVSGGGFRVGVLWKTIWSLGCPVLGFGVQGSGRHQLLHLVFHVGVEGLGLRVWG